MQQYMVVRDILKNGEIWAKKGDVFDAAHISANDLKSWLANGNLKLQAAEPKTKGAAEPPKTAKEQ